MTGSIRRSTLKYSSIGEAYKDLKMLPQQVTDAALEALNELADEMIWAAYSYVPVDTGTLKISIRKEPIENGVRVVAGGSQFINPKTRRPVNYAVYVEATQPFMRPAWNHVRGKAVATLERTVGDALER